MVLFGTYTTLLGGESGGHLATSKISLVTGEYVPALNLVIFNPEGLPKLSTKNNKSPSMSLGNIFILVIFLFFKKPNTSTPALSVRFSNTFVLVREVLLNSIIE